MSEEKVSCKEVMKHICESLGADLESDHCRAIKAHLNDCEGCQSYFKTVELTIDYYKKYNVDLPDNAHQKLMSILKLDDKD